MKLLAAYVLETIAMVGVIAVIARVVGKRGVKPARVIAIGSRGVALLWIAYAWWFICTQMG